MLPPKTIANARSNDCKQDVITISPVRALVSAPAFLTHFTFHLDLNHNSCPSTATALVTFLVQAIITIRDEHHPSFFTSDARNRSGYLKAEILCHSSCAFSSTDRRSITGCSEGLISSLPCNLSADLDLHDGINSSLLLRVIQ